MIDDADFYGDAGETNIIECAEGSPEGPPPLTLATTGVERIVTRAILAWHPHKGTYGMGGPGFYGFSLEQTSRFAQEWLVLRLWCAGRWLLLDDTWVEAPREQHGDQRPLFSSESGHVGWDNFSPKVVGSHIAEVDIKKSSSRLVLQKGSEVHVLEVPKDMKRLSFYPMAGRRRWNPQENQLEAWVLTQDVLWCCDE